MSNIKDGIARIFRDNTTVTKEEKFIPKTSHEFAEQVISYLKSQIEEMANPYGSFDLSDISKLEAQGIKPNTRTLQAVAYWKCKQDILSKLQ